MPKNAVIFDCEKCDFKCYKKSNYDKHLLTQKHKNVYEYLQDKMPNKIFECECGKVYNYRQSLYVHKKTCINNPIIPSTINENIVVDSSNNHIVQLLIKENSDFKNIIMELVKSNTDLQKQMIDVCKNIQPTTINNSNNNNNNTINKTFNLQLFLNEQCKDAMNIKDFVHSIHIEMADSKRVGKEGYVEGISKLIIEKLKATDIYKRPMHCSDAKRETMYIKENDVWTKDESENNEKMIRFVKDVDNKNYDFLVAYGNANPEVFDIDSKSNIPYLSMVSKSTRDHENVLKVIKKIIKEVIINK